MYKGYQMQMSQRIKYFLSHLMSSIFIACLVLCLIFFIWYPAPLAQAVGVNHIIFMLIGIDIIIGPILSLIVYKQGKKTLIFDLTVIILLQVSALTYGVYNIAQGRPAWIVYYKNSYELIRHSDVVVEPNTKVKSPWFGPEYAAVKLSRDPVKYDEELSIELSGYSLAQFPERYIDSKDTLGDMRKYGRPLSELQQFNSVQQVKPILLRYPKAAYFFPLKAVAEDMTVLVDQNYHVIQIVNLRPWQE